jgi:atypical dual specificity phosphatase
MQQPQKHTFHDVRPEDDSDLFEKRMLEQFEELDRVCQAHLKEQERQIEEETAAQEKKWMEENLMPTNDLVIEHLMEMNTEELLEVLDSCEKKADEPKKVILCSICNYVMLCKIGICQDCHENLKMTKITDRLYLTNLKNAQKYSNLLSLGIKQILVVGNDMCHHTEELKTKYIYIDDCATDDITQHFEEAHEFIKKDITVVHCYAGISRSPTVVISFLMKEHGMSLDEAFALCKQKRPIVDPNHGFMRQLRDYEMQLKNLKDFKTLQTLVKNLENEK